jgi:hypothetical protein
MKNFVFNDKKHGIHTELENICLGMNNKVYHFYDRYIFKNGLINGIYIVYDDIDNIISLLCYFKAGKLNGIYIMYDNFTKIKHILYFENDVRKW